MTGNSQIKLSFSAKRLNDSRAIYLLYQNELDDLKQSQQLGTWIDANGFSGKLGEVLFVPDAAGHLKSVLFGLGKNSPNCFISQDRFITGKLTKILPEGNWHFEGAHKSGQDVGIELGLGLALGAYQFTRYLKQSVIKSLAFHIDTDIDELTRLYQSTYLVRDLINTPTNDMGPDAIEAAVQSLGKTYSADVHVVCGDALLEQNFPLIHAVGRASHIAPRLIELCWGQKAHPLVTLVGKGVAFDTGGLDIKPSSGMLLMKKDMGGAANVLGLAKLIMDAKLPLQLRVLIPAVENSISSNAFRPSDIIQSRKGLSVEIGNTDAEGRLVLADALTYGDEQSPQLMLDMATLTGAARVALGPDLPPFYCDDNDMAAKISAASMAVHDPLWQMPLWHPYAHKLSSRIADLNNVTSDGFAGSITAALFLKNFVEKAKCWAHFDVYGWTPSEKPGFPVGGEAQGIRALYAVLKDL